MAALAIMWMTFLPLNICWGSPFLMAVIVFVVIVGVPPPPLGKTVVECLLFVIISLRAFGMCGHCVRSLYCLLSPIPLCGHLMCIASAPAPFAVSFSSLCGPLICIASASTPFIVSFSSLCVPWICIASAPAPFIVSLCLPPLICIASASAPFIVSFSSLCDPRSV